MTSPERVSYTELAFQYRGERVSIPLATSFSEVIHLVRTRVVPASVLLNNTEFEAGAMIENGVALSGFEYEGDGFADHNPEAAQAIVKALVDAGFPITGELKKLDALRPTRYDLLDHQISARAEYYYLNGDLTEKTFVVGPIFIGKAKTDLPDYFFDWVAEEEAARFWIPGCFAIDGHVFYERLHKKGDGRIFCGQIAELIKSLL